MLPKQAAVRATTLFFAFALACVGSAHAGWLDRIGLGSKATSQGSGLTLATWNIEWLMTPEEHARLAARCTSKQPRSGDRALPCTPGRKRPPSRTTDDFDALARSADALHEAHRVDAVALQEVDGPEAARRVFRSGWRVDCFTRRAHPQKVGFAIREGVAYRCNGDLTALDIDGSSREGADITLWPGTSREVRLLSVHLKSGCFNGKLDRRFEPCSRLRQQVPVIEAWIDQRVREGTPFAILGDFNRHLEKDSRHPAGADESAPLNMMQAWSDDVPRGAKLLRATEGQRYIACDAEDRHSQYIDDILIDERLGAQNNNKRFARLPHEERDQGRQLSDHCPVIWALKPNKNQAGF